MKKHVMLQIKTRGNQPNSVIIEIGAVQFDGNFNSIPYYFNNSILESQPNRLIDENVADTSIPINKLPLQIVLNSLSSWVVPIYNSPQDNIVFWGRGINEQLAILNDALAYYGIIQPWKYSDIAEVSTFDIIKPSNIEVPVTDQLAACRTTCLQQIAYLKSFVTL